MSKIQMPENIRKLAQERAHQFYKTLRIPQPDHYQVGQIWSTKNRIILGNNHILSSDEPRIVVVLVEDDKHLIVAPISLEIQMAGEYDLVLRDEASPLSFDFLIEIWNEVPILPDHLYRCLGSISNHFVELIQELHSAYLLGDEISERLKSHVGSFIYERDSRLEFQEVEVNAIRYLSQAATYSLLNSKPVKQRNQQHILDFGIPILKSLSQLFNPQQPSVAFASGGSTEDDKGYIVSYDDADPTIMQISVSKRRYVYLIVHKVSKQLESQHVLIRLKIMDELLTSEPTILKTGIRIDLGEYQGFKSDDVKDSITLEIIP